MDTCQRKSSHNKHSGFDYEFKSQGIYSPQQKLENIGMEILVDFERSNINTQWNIEMILSEASEVLVSKVRRNLSSKQISNWHNKYIFINLERSNLCNLSLIDHLTTLSQHLRMQHINLVIEITERNPCGECNSVKAGLEHLHHAGLKLAVDDFELYKGDFRTHEIDQHHFDYIKVDMPRTDVELTLLESFIQTRSEHIIVERIENKEQLKKLENLSGEIWGYQGYLFDMGTHLTL